MRQFPNCWRGLRYLLPLVALGCGDPKLKVGLNVGLAGADVGSMAASEIRMSGAAKDRRFEVRILQQRAFATGQITDKGIGLALDSLAGDEKVAVVLSRFLSDEELKVAKRYIAENVPFLSVTPMPPGYVSANGPGFSLVPSLDEQGRFLANQANAGERIAIVHIRNAYGATLAAALTNALKARGMQPVDVRTYDQSWDEPRMVALGSELELKSHPDVVFFLGRAPSLELVWQPFREGAKEIRFIGSDLVESVTLYNNPEGRYTGLQYVRFFDPKAQEERMKDLSERYGMWIGRGEMTAEAVFVYDGMMMIGEAVRSGARTREQFRQYFASLGRTRPPFSGVGGLISFDQNGEARRPFQLGEVRSDGVFPVEKSETVQ